MKIRYIRLLYTIIGFFHICAYLFYRNRIPEIKEDLCAFGNGSDCSIKDFIKILSWRHEYRNAFYYRLPFLSRQILNIILPKVKDCHLERGSMTIGGGLVIHHGWSSVINAEKVGSGFQFYQNVTVGIGKGGKPVIGDNVIIYTGAVVVGNILIGNNVRIAANSVVRKDVPSLW